MDWDSCAKSGAETSSRREREGDGGLGFADSGAPEQEDERNTSAAFKETPGQSSSEGAQALGQSSSEGTEAPGQSRAPRQSNAALKETPGKSSADGAHVGSSLRASPLKEACGKDARGQSIAEEAGATSGSALTISPLKEACGPSEPVAFATPAWNRTLQPGGLIHLDSTPGVPTDAAADDAPPPDEVDVPQNGEVECVQHDVPPDLVAEQDVPENEVERVQHDGPPDVGAEQDDEVEGVQDNGFGVERGAPDPVADPPQQPAHQQAHVAGPPGVQVAPKLVNANGLLMERKLGQEPTTRPTSRCGTSHTT